MTLERLTFENPDIPYHSYHAAQHVVRYAAVRNIVAGKRVLDIACGEGYGARLLRDWGARDVVGVDLFPAAIAAAKRLFSGEGISFLVCNAEELEKTLDGVEPFDLIVSFETIEHLARPERFLASLPGLLAPGGAIVISCPNDRAYSAEHDNPFHLKAYSFEAFRNLTQKHLGEAAMWMLGAPLLGEMNFLPNDRLVQDAHDAPIAMTQTGIVENTVFVPAQSNLTTDEQTCSHYIGVWGISVPPNAVISSLSVPSYHEPWKILDYLKGRAKELEEAITTRYEPALARLQASESELLGQREEIGQLRDANDRLTAERDRLSEDKAALQSRIRDTLEPQIATLADEADSLKEEVGRIATVRDALQTANGNLTAETTELAGRIRDVLEPQITVLVTEALTLKNEIGHLETVRDALQAVNDRLSTEITELADHIRDVLEPRITTLTGEADFLKDEIGQVVVARDTLQAENNRLDAEATKLADRIRDVLEPRITTLTGAMDSLGQEVDRLSEEKSGLEVERDRLKAEKAALEDRVGLELEPEIHLLASEAETLRGRLSQALEEQESHRCKLQAVETQLSELEARRTDYYEPELATLRAHIEHATFEKEVQSLRSRLMAHAERSRRAAESVAAMQHKLHEAQELHQSWFGPEIDRLNGIIAEYETTKREWWDPQLELRTARIEELEANCRDWYEPQIALRDARIAELEQQLGSS